MAQLRTYSGNEKILGTLEVVGLTTLNGEVNMMSDVGIGSTSPLGKLEVELNEDNSASNPFTATPILRLDNPNSAAGIYAPLHFHMGSGEYAIVSGFRPADNDAALLIGFRSADTANVWAERFRIWDDGRVIIHNILRAMSSSGLRLEDDAGNLGIMIEDGGNVRLGAERIISLDPGSIASGVTKTITITTSSAANRLTLMDVSFTMSAGGSALRRCGMRDVISFQAPASLGSNGIIRSQTRLLEDTQNVTLTGPTAVTNGFQYTVTPSGSTLNDNYITLIVHGLNAPNISVAAT